MSPHRRPLQTRPQGTPRHGPTSRRRPHGLVLTVLAILATGCASVSPDDTLAPTRARLGGAAPTLQADDAARQAAQRQAATLLSQPLSAATSVEIALLNSPQLQALVAEAWATDLDAQARGRPANLHLAWERLVHDGGSEFTRSLGLGLNDWLLWPLRQRQAAFDAQAGRTRLAAQVLATQQAVRQQWVRAVAARAMLAYQGQVREAADASAELARRMQAVGHFSRLQRARQQAFQADAVAQLTRATAQALAEREALVRLLGLDAAQAERLQLPERLPELPTQARSPADVAAAAQARVPLGVASAQADSAAQRALPPALHALPGLELTLSRSRSGTELARGTELGLNLPLSNAATPAQARALAAQQRLAQAQIDQASRLRESYALYRQAHDLARHQREVLVPLRQTIRDEVLLQYNGMLTSVFELLAEARAQVTAVMSALDAQRDFWLADAALQAAIDGVPWTGPASSGTAGGAAPKEATDAAGH